MHYKKIYVINTLSSNAKIRKIASFLLVREGRSPAESRLEVCRLVRLGAAVETQTVFPPLPEDKCLYFGAGMRVVPRKVCLSSLMLGRKGFFVAFYLVVNLFQKEFYT